MKTQELERRIEEIRRKPLLLCCVDAKGRRAVMTVSECIRTKAAYIHIVADDLDSLLSDALSGREN